MKLIWLKILLFQQVLNLNTNFGVSFAIEQTTIIVKEATCLKFYPSIIAKITKSANLCNKCIWNHNQRLKIHEKMQNLWLNRMIFFYFSNSYFYIWKYLVSSQTSYWRKKIYPLWLFWGLRMCKDYYYRHFGCAPALNCIDALIGIFSNFGNFNRVKFQIIAFLTI